MISIQNLSKSYQNHQALQHVSIEVPKGSIYGLIGHNGAGKTTIIRILTQIIKADLGTVSIGGELLHPKHRFQIGYLPEERGLYKKMTVRDYLVFLGNLRAMEKQKLKQSIGVWLDKFDLKSMETKEINALSKGNQQKVQFIATVFFDPSILILDEPFSGFDPSNAELLKREILQLNQQGTTILFSTHQMEAVEELCEEFSMLDNSKIVLSGNLAKVKKEFGTQEVYIKTTEKLGLSKDWHTEIHKEGVKIKIADGQSKKQLMSELDVSQLIVFQELEPSLREIFLHKVQK